MKTFVLTACGLALSAALALPAAAQRKPAPAPKRKPAPMAAAKPAAPAPPKETPPPGGPARDFQLPARTNFTLSNGLLTRLVPYGNIPKVNILVAVRAAKVNEPAGQDGVSTLLAKLMQEGTTSRTAAAVAEQAARMGGSLYVGAGNDETRIYADCLSEYAPAMLALLADVVQHPALPAAELPRLKTDLKRQYNLQRGQPGTQAEQKLLGSLYPGQAYGRPLPTDAQVDALTIEQARAFYQAEFGAQRTAIFIAGKFDPAAARKAVETNWTSWPTGPAPRLVVAKPATQTTLLTQDRPDAPQSTLMLGLPVANPTSPDYIALRVTNSLLGGSFGSRITRNIREDKGYTYSPYSYLDADYHTALWVQAADVTTKDTYNSLKEIVNEIERLQKTPPTADELRGIQNYEVGTFVLRNSSPGGIVSQLDGMHLQGQPDTYLTEQVQRLNAVTPEQVSALTRKYIRPEAMTTVVVGDQKVIAPQLKQYQAMQKKAL
jgi:predicted Zn-dependent peptidase